MGGCVVQEAKIIMTLFAVVIKQDSMLKCDLHYSNQSLPLQHPIYTIRECVWAQATVCHVNVLHNLINIFSHLLSLVFCPIGL